MGFNHHNTLSRIICYGSIIIVMVLLVKSEAALLMEKRFLKRLKPIVTKIDEQNKRVDYSGLLYLINILLVILFYLFFFQILKIRY